MYIVASLSLFRRCDIYIIVQSAFALVLDVSLAWLILRYIFNCRGKLPEGVVGRRKSVIRLKSTQTALSRCGDGFRLRTWRFASKPLRRGEKKIIYERISRPNYAISPQGNPKQGAISQWVKSLPAMWKRRERVESSAAHFGRGRFLGCPRPLR